MEVETEGGERWLPDPGEGTGGLMELVVLRALSRETDAGEEGKNNRRGQAEGDCPGFRSRHRVRGVGSGGRRVPPRCVHNVCL